MEKLDHLIRPVGYGIQTYTITTMSLLKEVQELPELFMKSKKNEFFGKRCVVLRSKLRLSWIIVI